MHDRGHERGLGPRGERLPEMPGFAGAAGRDHRHLDVRRDLARQLQVVAVTRAVRIDRGHEQLTGARRDGCGRPPGRGDAPRLPPAVRDHLSSARVDRAHDRLRAELRRQVGQQLRLVHRRAVDGDLVGAAAQEAAGVLEPRDAAAHRERHSQRVGRTLDEIQHRSATLQGRRDVEEDDLVRAQL